MGGRISTEAEQVFVTTTAVVALVVANTNLRARRWFLEDWGLDPKIAIVFSLNTAAPENEYLAGRRDFSIASVRLGEDLDVDAVLRFEADRLMMRRQNGSLTLYDWWPDWTDPKTIAVLPLATSLPPTERMCPKPLHRATECCRE